jgi:hypothetical protein
MSKFHRAGLLAGIVAAIAASSGYAVEQKDIDKAIAAGVKSLRRLQTGDGAWPPHRDASDATPVGATALAGLTLLECDAKNDDEAVFRAAQAVRRASPTLTYNYAICLSILFFDRLGDPGDIPLIESLTVRLLAGQTSSGGWNYRCPPVPDAEVRRMQAKLASRKELIGRRNPPTPDGVQRTAKELSPEIQQQLALLKRAGGMGIEMGSDNSNTQFATLALWVARRYGLPVEDALQRVGRRFRNSQRGDGGWSYFGPDMRGGGSPWSQSTASMTCAGLLGLAIADGKAFEKVRENKPGAKPAKDANKDRQIRKGLLALSTAIGTSSASKRVDQGPLVPKVGGRTYYFLWSLERVAVALDLKTIGNKDWYAWGAEILLANQQSDGSWQGSYGECGADTCFALLFLKRANLATDLTKQLTGRIQDPGRRILKRGELNEGIALAKNGDLPSGIEDKNAKPNRDGQYPAQLAEEKQPPPKDKKQPARADADKPPPKKPAADDSPTSPAASMADELANANAGRHGLLLKIYRNAKGAQYTEVLALAIPKLKGDLQRKTRQALAERLTRMKDSTLKAYLNDEDLEIRTAAARACAKKGSKALIPDLIPLVRETRGIVAEAAHQALKELSGQDFGPKAGAGREERVKAAQQWSEWWSKQAGK